MLVLLRVCADLSSCVCANLSTCVFWSQYVGAGLDTSVYWLGTGVLLVLVPLYMLVSVDSVHVCVLVSVHKCVLVSVHMCVLISVYVCWSRVCTGFGTCACWTQYMCEY